MFFFLSCTVSMPTFAPACLMSMERAKAGKVLPSWEFHIEKPFWGRFYSYFVFPFSFGFSEANIPA